MAGLEKVKRNEGREEVREVDRQETMWDFWKP